MESRQPLILLTCSDTATFPWVWSYLAVATGRSSGAGQFLSSAHLAVAIEPRLRSTARARCIIAGRYANALDAFRTDACFPLVSAATTA
jgi:hypothetical protein